MIDSRLGGPRTDAKAAPKEEAPRPAESRLALAGFGPGEIGCSKQPDLRRWSTRGYRHPVDEVVEWYCSEQRLSLFSFCLDNESVQTTERPWLQAADLQRR